MKAKSHLICFILFLLFSVRVIAQQQNSIPESDRLKKDFWDKIYIGGNFGLQFGTTTVVNLSPQVGYRVSEKFVPGIGITYIYYSYKIPGYQRVESNIYGGSGFAKYFFTQNLFAHGEFEELNLEGHDDSIPPHLKRLWVPSFFIGGGYNQSIGGRAFIQLLILFEVLQDRNSPYYRSNPVVRIGFGF